MTADVFMLDYENVQPASLGSLVPGRCRIMVFLGENQPRLPVDLVKALQPFGADAEYLRITGSGPNAVDFHIAFYIGRRVAEWPTAAFTIVSKDTGFDPLVKHLNGLKIPCKRIATLPGSAKAVAAKAATAAAVKPAAAKNVQVIVEKPSKPAAKVTSAGAMITADRAKQLAESLARLKGMKSARPTRKKTLDSSLRSWFSPTLDSVRVEWLVQQLIASGKVGLEGEKVTYRF